MMMTPPKALGENSPHILYFLLLPYKVQTTWAPLSKWAGRGSERWSDLPSIAQWDSQPALWGPKAALLWD